MGKKIYTIDFLPLAIFAWGPHLLGFTQQNGSWESAFYLGAASVLLQMAYSWYKNYSFDYIALGANAFLIYGALAYALHPALLFPYELFKQSIIFVWILLVGLITTLVTPEGFIQGSSTIKQQNFPGSLALLGLTALALLISYSILNLSNAGTVLSTIVPFVLLLAGRAVISEHFEGKTS